MSLRLIIKDKTGVDVNQCHECWICDIPENEGMDIPLGSIIQLVLLNDEEALHSRTIWSDTVLEQARLACKHNLNLHWVLLALREEAQRRGIKP